MSTADEHTKEVKEKVLDELIHAKEKLDHERQEVCCLFFLQVNRSYIFIRKNTPRKSNTMFWTN